MAHSRRIRLNGKADFKGRAVTLSGLKADFAIKHPAKLLLSDESYDVRCASNGIEALDRVKQRVPDLLITEWTMPVNGRGRTVPPSAGPAEFWHVFRFLLIPPFHFH